MATSDFLLAPVKIMYAAVGTTPPAASVEVGGDWPAGWTRLGEATKEPLKLSYSYEEVELDIQEALGPIARKRTNEKAEASTVLSEYDLDLVSAAMSGGTVTDVPQASGTPESESFSVGGEVNMNKYAFGFEGETEAGLPFRIFMWIGTMSSGDLVFGKKDYVGIPVNIKALSDQTKAKGERMLKFERVTAAAW